MDKQPYIQTRQSGNPSKILMGSALIIALSLPYVLVKNFSHPNPQVLQPTHSSSEQLKSEQIEEVNVDNIKSKPLSHIIVETPAPSLLINQEPNSTPIQTTKLIAQSAVKATLTTVPTPQGKKEITHKAVTVANSIKDNKWQTIHPRAGDSMATIFHRLGLSAQNLQLVVYKNPYAKALSAIKPSQKLKFLIANHKLEQLVFPLNDIQTLTIYRSGTNYKTKVDSKKVTSKERYVTGIVKGSLYTTAQRMGIPQKLIHQMTQVLSKQVDFTHGVRSGDHFAIAYEAQYVQDKMVGIGEILATSYSSKGKTAQAVRHRSRNGSVDYYTPQGESFKKAFSRYPMRFSHISSTFTTSRYHPILHYRRAHKGIDLAAPIGTPIQATGDGVIQTIGRHNGYGNMIQIKHDTKFTTLYGHMLRFQKGLSKGSRVKRGQIIGYVGQTGLASGPHCHYELHVHGQPRNPTTTSLPTASPVPAREMASFKAKTNSLFAKLKALDSGTTKKG